ncbi:MAG: hypothetical protein WCD89_04445 [Anaerocolumna sp.]
MKSCDLKVGFENFNENYHLNFRINTWYALGSWRDRTIFTPCITKTRKEPSPGRALLKDVFLPVKSRHLTTAR